MLAIFGCLLLATAVASSAIDSQPCHQEPCPVGGEGNELLERRVAELELKLQNQSALLESIVSSLNELKQHSSQMLDQQVRHHKRLIESCDEATTSGRYRLQLADEKLAPIAVICDMEVLDGGWLVIQRRFTGSVGFNRSWAEYRDGFGTAAKSGEFWFGLEAIHQLTKAGEYELLVQLKYEYSDGYARYQRFQIAGEDEGYELVAVDEYHGNMGNQLVLSKNNKFSTFDRNNDRSSDRCAKTFGCGWWFNGCSFVILNGPFQKDSHTKRGIYWAGWVQAASYSRMLIRRRFS